MLFPGGKNIAGVVRVGDWAEFVLLFCVLFFQISTVGADPLGGMEGGFSPLCVAFLSWTVCIRQTNRHTDTQTERHRQTQTDRQKTDSQTETETETETQTETDRQTDKQTDRQTEREREKEIDR